MNGPVYVDWAVSNVCNLNCHYCVGMEAGGLSPEEAMKIAEEIIGLAPQWVILEGGEPLLREDLLQIGARLKEAGIDVFVITNGNAFTAERLRRLASFSPKVLFSIDGADAQTYESIKRGAKFGVALEWAKKCAELGIFQGITVVLSRLNLQHAPEFIPLTQRLGGKTIIFLPLKPFGEDKAAQSYYHHYALSPQEQGEAIKEIYNGNSDLDIFYDEPFLWNLSHKYGFPLSHGHSGVTIPEVKGCAALYSLYIQANGDVRPCMFSPKGLSLGNARREPLEDIWQRAGQSPVLTRWADPRLRKGACGQCPDFDSCRGCLARTVRLLGNATEADPCCPLAT